VKSLPSKKPKSFKAAHQTHTPCARTLNSKCYWPLLPMAELWITCLLFAVVYCNAV
jgi:hypothetical protein